MALQHTRLTEVVSISDSAAAIYTNPSSTTSHVRGFLFHNTGSGSETVLLYWVPDSTGSAGTAADSNRIMSISLIAGETLLVEIPYGLVLEDTNETIQAVTDTANTVNVVVLGDKDA